MGRSEGTGGTGDDDVYRPFRARFGTLVAYTAALLVLGGCVVVALVATGPGATSAVNRAATVGFGLLCAALAWRLGAVRALPDPAGLTVINLVHRRRLEWAEIVAVRFGPGDPWVRLDLADGHTLAVMGVQRSDGAHGVAQARRLLALVRAHGEAPDR